MRTSRAITLCIVTLLMTAGVVLANEQEWLDLTDKAIGFFQVGNKKEAIAVARQALKMGEEIFGPEDLKIVGSLDDLASYLKSTGENAEAEALYKRALAILDKKLPPTDRYLAIFLDYFANFYDSIGRPDDAKVLKDRAKMIRSNARKAANK